MARLALKTDYQDGNILYGDDLNRTNEQVNAAHNAHDDLIIAISAYIQNILPNAKDYTDEQIAAAVEDFTLTEAYKKDITDLNSAISEVGAVASGAASAIEAAVSAANSASGKADDTFDALNLFVNETYLNDQSVLRTQIDGKIESHFQDADPNTWEEEDRIKHNGDVWYSETTKLLKRYKSDTNEWIEIHDKSALDAYEDASKAQTTADGKCTTFVTTPTTPYKIGDLWSGGGTGDLKICKTSKETGAYDASDWELATKYTDDSALNGFINDNYSNFVSAVNGLTMLYYSFDDPSIDWNTTEKKDLHVGSLWRDRNTNIIYRYDKSADETPVYSWQSDNIPTSIFDQIDGKKAIYTELPSSYEKNDIFIVSPEIEDLPSYIHSGDILIASNANTVFDWADWSKKDGYVQQSSIDAASGPIIQDLNNVINDMDLNSPTSKLSQIVQTINAVTTNFQIKGGSNLIPNSLQLFESLNNDIFEKTGVWEIRQNQDIAENTISKFMNYCTEAGKIKWVINVNPETAYTLSLIYNNLSGETSTLKLTNGNKVTLIDTTLTKSFEYFGYGFVTNSNTITIEIETNGTNFGYSDLMLNYGAIIEGSIVSANALKWQPAPGENFGTIIKLSYEGEEITMKNGLFKHIMDNTGDRIILVETGETITELDENGISTIKGTFENSIEVGLFTQLKIDTENQIEF